MLIRKAVVWEAGAVDMLAWEGTVQVSCIAFVQPH